MGTNTQQLDIPSEVENDPTAQEVIRVWTGDSEYVALTGKLYPDPGAWGHLFCQLARHVARAYQLNEMGDREEVLAAIRERFIQAWELGDESTGELVDE